LKGFFNVLTDNEYLCRISLLRLIEKFYVSLSTMKTFKQTSDKPYDRHHYKLVYTNDQSVIFDNYEELRLEWYNTPEMFRKHVEVLDIKTKKTKKGFND